MMNISALVGKTVKGKLIKDADDFSEIFLDKEMVAVVSGKGFEAPEYVRWSYATSLDNIKEGIKRLKNLLN